MHSEISDFAAWVANLRERLAAGNLAGLWYVSAEGVTLRADNAARIMLSDLDYDETLTVAQRRTPFNIGRRRALLSDLRRLREQLG